MDRAVLKQIREFEKGDYVKVSWFDANDNVGKLEDHKKQPQVLVWEWGVFLACEGSPKHVILGKHYVPAGSVWEATRIPLMLIQSVEIVAKRACRTMFLRRYQVQQSRRNVVKVKDCA